MRPGVTCCRGENPPHDALVHRQCDAHLVSGVSVQRAQRGGGERQLRGVSPGVSAAAGGPDLPRTGESLTECRVEGRDAV